jgi:hypothetical protein
MTTEKEIQNRINETVDAMILDLLNALVKSGVTSEQIKSAVDFMLAEIPDDHA